MRVRVLAFPFATLPLLTLALLSACSGGNAEDSAAAPSSNAAASSSPSTAGGTTAPSTTAVDADPAVRTKPSVDVPATPPDELFITNLAGGRGQAAEPGSIVTVNYIVVLQSDGSVVDNSYDRGHPIPVVLGAGGVIPGFDQGLLGAQPGARRQIDVPADLAYGEHGKPPSIGPNEALTFVVDVLSVSPPTPAP